MDALCGTWAIRSSSGDIGTLTVGNDGLYLVFDAVCHTLPCRKKLELECSGATYPLGLPIPEGSVFRLRTRRSVSSLRSAGITSITGCRIAEAEEALWRPVDAPGALLHDPDLRHACADIKGVLLCKEQIAFPLSADADFPLLPVFCFGEPGRIRGKDYILFRLLDGEIV